jgi:hypothetical protein
VATRYDGPDEPDALRAVGKCGAKNRPAPNAKYRFCHDDALPNGRCKKHGGKSVPAGPDHHAYVHGLRSKAKLTREQRRRVAELVAGEGLLVLNEDIALVDVQLDAAWDRIGVEPSAADWKSLRRQVVSIRDRANAGDARGLMAAVDDALRAVESGSVRATAVDDWRRLQDHRRRLVATEVRNRAVSQQSVALTSVAALFVEIARLANDSISNDDDRGAFRNGLARLVSSSDVLADHSGSLGGVDDVDEDD